ncbi:tRNA (adenine22-N1)-methyltransferase [Candidatus Phytoplasma luffae]|uniref:tRNA (Adenine22-N1)-methyltransferase n=1 Tax=Loofah witches'-broom phytoplasma TaxID=35773 RepID=A0A975FIV3_LOWBP|nr:tRNA (adenine(22)-N(1))-methyltransferase TrmK [Candidatus Phytoplasma luffae]QTX02669.1 tRNA (adenine22-N1)-methyltransferase [Candidatus Phytoplasma luffae]
MSRIDFIVSLVKGYNIVLDIGSDHGLVLKKALDLGYIKKGIASDNKIQPLDRASHNLKNYSVKFYLSDGFEKIYSDFDLAVICGMGPYTISKILAKCSFKNKYFLLGCQGKINYLIEWLKSNNFAIIDTYHYYNKFDYIFLKVFK